MFNCLHSIWVRSGTNRSGIPLGTVLLFTLLLALWFGGFQDSVCLEKGGVHPGHQVDRFWLCAFSHLDVTSVLYSVTLLLCLGVAQERLWGTALFLLLSLLSALLPVLTHTWILYVSGMGKDAGQPCGYSPAHLAMLTAQCRHLSRWHRLTCPPLALPPLVFLVLNITLQPGTSLGLHLCAITVGLCYSPVVTDRLQRSLGRAPFRFLPDWAFISTTPRSLLPTSSTSNRPVIFSESHGSPQRAEHRPTFVWSRMSPAHDWLEGKSELEAELLDEELLRAGILASLQDVVEGAEEKVKVPKSSVSSLRLQQLQKMGFPTEKAVVALAAAGKLDGAISLLIDDQVGEDAVVTCKGKSSAFLQAP